MSRCQSGAWLKFRNTLTIQSCSSAAQPFWSHSQTVCEWCEGSPGSLGNNKRTSQIGARKVTQKVVGTRFVTQGVSATVTEYDHKKWDKCGRQQSCRVFHWKGYDKKRWNRLRSSQVKLVNVRGQINDWLTSEISQCLRKRETEMWRYRCPAPRVRAAPTSRPPSGCRRWQSASVRRLHQPQLAVLSLLRYWSHFQTVSRSHFVWTTTKKTNRNVLLSIRHVSVGSYKVTVWRGGSGGAPHDRQVVLGVEMRLPPFLPRAGD